MASSKEILHEGASQEIIESAMGRRQKERRKRVAELEGKLGVGHVMIMFQPRRQVLVDLHEWKGDPD